MTLQAYMIQTVKEDLERHNAYKKSPVSELVDQLSSEELIELMEQIKKKKDDSKKK